ncbi:MAG: hypothetical protein ABEJ58_06350 [Halodesulfurarchaeum sp.]
MSVNLLLVVVVDIHCPDCDSVDSVEKVGIGRYHCRECNTEFTKTDIERPE